MKNKFYSDKEWLKKKYLEENKSLREISEICKINKSTLMKWIKKFELKKDMSLQRLAAKKTNLDKYGVENPFQYEKFKDVIKENNLIKYGVEYPAQSEEIKEKIKETNLKRYGNKCFLATEIAKENRENLMLERYGGKTTLESPYLKQKYKDTMNFKYGVLFPTQISDINIIKKENSLKKWGVEHFSKSEEYWKSKVNCFKIDELPIYTFARKYKYPSSSLNNLIHKSSLNKEQLKDIIINYNIINGFTDIELAAIKLLNNIERFNKVPKGIDFYRPDFIINENTFVNIDGLYWHSELNKDKMYHFNMRRLFEAKGIRLYQFYSNELYEKYEIINSIIQSNEVDVIKEFILKDVSFLDAKCFFDLNSLKDLKKSKSIGLYYNNDLVSCMLYKVLNNKIIIEGYSEKLKTIVTNSFSKLLTKIEENNKFCSTIEYWVDLRYENGFFLKELGFKHIKDVLSWKWTDGRKNVYNKKKYSKFLAKNLGLVKIYDAGQRLYRKELK